jgi:thioredoxin 1
MAVVELTKENFEQVVTSNPTVIVDFWAPWCGPCKGFAPVFDRVSESNPDVVFAKVNTDDEQEIASHFQIRSIPTLMVFREQIIVFSQPGALPQSALEQVVTKAKQLDMAEVRQQMSAQGGAPGGEAGEGASPTH